MSKYVSVFDRNLLIKGEIFSDSSIDICGRVTGTIVANGINLKDCGFIDGNVYAKELALNDGTKIKGNVFASKIRISKNAEIEGDVSYSNICIEDGARIIGKCCIFTEEKIDDLIAKKKGNLFEKQESK